MMLSFAASLLLTLGAVADETPGWFVPPMVAMSGSEGPPPAKALHRTGTEGPLRIQSTIEIARPEGNIVIHLAVRGCAPGIVDYRQSTGMARLGSIEAEVAALRQQAARMFDVLEEKCGLPAGRDTAFMAGLESGYAEVYQDAANYDELMRKQFASDPE